MRAISTICGAARSVPAATARPSRRENDRPPATTARAPAAATRARMARSGSPPRTSSAQRSAAQSRPRRWVAGDLPGAVSRKAAISAGVSAAAATVL